MTAILFYHLERRSFDDVLPELIERTLGRGQRAIIRTDSAERAQAVDNLLWTWNDESFVPHALAGDGEPSAQPVLITLEEGNPNGAELLFLVGGAVPISWQEDQARFARIVMIFDGHDEAQVAAARGAWTKARNADCEATYWKQSPSGKWEKQA